MDPSLLRGAYDREAPAYDARFEAQQVPKAEVFARLVAPPPPGARVLDLGAGTGLLPRTLVAREPAWRLCRWLLVDLSGRMLTQAAAHGLPAVVGDARKLPVRTASCTLVTSLTGIVAAEHVRPVMASAARVLVDG